MEPQSTTSVDLLPARYACCVQAGFSLLEAGTVRYKNTRNIMIEDALDTCVSNIAFWVFGYAFAFGEGTDLIGWRFPDGQVSRGPGRLPGSCLEVYWKLHGSCVRASRGPRNGAPRACASPSLQAHSAETRSLCAYLSIIVYWCSNVFPFPPPSSRPSPGGLWAGP